MIDLQLISSNNFDGNCLADLKSFENEVYNVSFPDADERENFEDILQRIKSAPDEPSSLCVLAKEDGLVKGGLVVDWYESTGDLEIIYIATSPEFRGGKVGNKLISDGMAMIVEYLGKDRISNVFLEMEKPTDPITSFDNVTRYIIWNKWGAQLIPIHYTQPSLSDGKEEKELLLLALPQFCKCEKGISAIELKNFLQAFYKGLKAADHPKLTEMLDEIDYLTSDPKKKVICFEKLEEQSKLKFSNFSVTTHFLAKEKESWPKDGCICPKLNSFECDLMNYSHQLDRPFKTIHYATYKNIELIFPRLYSYCSEGFSHFRIQARRSHKVKISISVCVLPSSKRHIVNLSLAPCEEEFFSENDVIKLITQFGSHQENVSYSDEFKLKVDGAEFTFIEFIKKYVHDGDYSQIPNGVSQFDINSVFDENDENVLSTEYLNEIVNKNVFEDNYWNRVLCGIILGIYDFDRMSEAEIEDTVKPIVTTNSSFMVLCRGHLLKIEDCDEDTRHELNTILVSAYILVPSEVLAINDILLSECENYVSTSLDNTYRPSSSFKVQAAKSILTKEYLNDVFQYDSEKEIFAKGQSERSLDTRFADVTEKVNLLLQHEEKGSEIVLEAMLGLLALLQVGEILSGKLQFSTIFSLMLTIFIIIELVRWIRTKHF